MLLFSLALLSFFTVPCSLLADTPSEMYVPDDATINARFGEMNCLVKPKLTPAVRSYMKTYLQLRRAHSEVILGKTVMYFPMFEKKFREHDMPEDLKYLSIVESALRPKATSRVGAGGLWQFMPETGYSYGLEINEYRDDRSDPEMSTEAAIAYLKNAHNRFGNWELALAAYNSGAGRVNRAVRRARSKNFWKIQRYLPRETRAYVPAFIAATYLCKYYADHGLTPQYPSLDMQMTQTVKIYDHISFYKIGQLTGLSQYVIEDLNPAYNMGFVPANGKGYTLTLPKRVMQTVLDYLSHIKRPDGNQRDLSLAVTSVTIKSRPIKTDTRDEYFESMYTVQEGETMERIAEMYGITKNNIMAWNNLTSPYAYVGQELKIFHPHKIERWSPRTETEEAPPIESLALTPFAVAGLDENMRATRVEKATSYKKKRAKKAEVKSTDVKKKAAGNATKMRGNYIYYRLEAGESLQDAADKFPGVRLQDILELNKLKKVRKGLKIRIKKIDENME